MDTSDLEMVLDGIISNGHPSEILVRNALHSLGSVKNQINSIILVGVAMNKSNEDLNKLFYLSEETEDDAENHIDDYINLIHEIFD